MSKLTREQKIEIYHKRKSGVSLSTLSNLYRVNKSNIKYLIRLIDAHGTEILRNDKNRGYSASLKEEIINKVLIEHQSSSSIAISYGLFSVGMLSNWIRSYKDNNYVIVVSKKGRKTTMENNTNSKNYKEMTPEEKVKYLENKNLYLEAENEYLKKLRAVVLARKNQQPKTK